MAEFFFLIAIITFQLKDSMDETAKCILLRVHLDNIKSLVNDFLYPIYQEKGSSPVAAIKRYITLLVASRNSFSTWLERSVSCIELLHNEDDRLESALLVLQVLYAFLKIYFIIQSNHGIFLRIPPFPGPKLWHR